MTRRAPLVAILMALVAVLLAAPSADADQMGWHSEAPIGVLGVQAPLGRVGDIEFWSPNRGVLITEGIEGGAPPGVYA